MLIFELSHLPLSSRFSAMFDSTWLHGCLCSLLRTRALRGWKGPGKETFPQCEHCSCAALLRSLQRCRAVEASTRFDDRLHGCRPRWRHYWIILWTSASKGALGHCNRRRYSVERTIFIPKGVLRLLVRSVLDDNDAAASNRSDNCPRRSGGRMHCSPVSARSCQTWRLVQADSCVNTYASEVTRVAELLEGLSKKVTEKFSSRNTLCDLRSWQYSRRACRRAITPPAFCQSRDRCVTKARLRSRTKQLKMV